MKINIRDSKAVWVPEPISELELVEMALVDMPYTFVEPLVIVSGSWDAGCRIVILRDLTTKAFFVFTAVLDHFEGLYGN